MSEELIKRLFSLKDEGYAQFHRKLIPTVDPETVIGVRTPELRKLAKQIYRSGNAYEFLAELPHRYFEENQLHSFIICEIKDFDSCLEETEKFLPYVDNWATCDQLSPKVFGKNADRLLPHIEQWIHSDSTYTIRFGIGMLMTHFLDDRFDMKLVKMLEAIRSDEYYVNMMLAWYFATALAKQYEQILPTLTEHRLDKWVHNKTIQKAVESYRITDEQKAYLKTLRIK